MVMLRGWLSGGSACSGAQVARPDKGKESQSQQTRGKATTENQRSGLARSSNNQAEMKMEERERVDNLFRFAARLEGRDWFNCALKFVVTQRQPPL